MIYGEWAQGQQNLITFMMVDSNGAELSGLGDALTVKVAKNTSDAATGAGTKGEITGLNGRYWYLSTAAEANTPGTVSVEITGAGAVQQNLEYVVLQRNINGVEFTYTVTDGTDPIEGVDVSISTDLAGQNVIWKGVTNSVGVAVDLNGRKPFIEAGTYYFWSQKSGYSFSNPDIEVVS